MPNISFYISSQDVNIQLGTDTILILGNQPPPSIDCDFTSTIEISKNDLRGIYIQLNNPDFNIISPYPEDISITIDPDIMMNNVFSNLSMFGNLVVDTNSATKERIAKIFSYIANPSHEETIILDIVNQTYNGPEYIGFFKNENDVLSVLNSNLIDAVYNKNMANINSMITYNKDPLIFQYQRNINPVVNDTINIFNDICKYKPGNLNRLNSSNNYKAFLVDLLDDNDNISFVVTYNSNDDQKTFLGSTPTNRLPTKACIKIIIKDSTTTTLFN
jgi:hypothetical protein